eukprot:gene19798-6942_t
MVVDRVAWWYMTILSLFLGVFCVLGTTYHARDDAYRSEHKARVTADHEDPLILSLTLEDG